MSSFTVHINTDNAAFDDDEGGVQEIMRILAVVIAKVSQGEGSGNLMDFNGNTVGEFTFDEND